MKKIIKTILICAVAAFTISGCAMVNVINDATITGNGDMVDEQIELNDSWDGIFIEDLEATIYISPEKTNIVKYTMDENLLSKVEIVVEDEVLSIRSKDGTNMRSKEDIKIYVGTDQIKNIIISGGAVIESLDTLNTDDFTLESSGGCKVVLDINCNSATISSSGAAMIDMTGKSETASFTVSGAGKINAKEFIVDDLDVQLSGAAVAEVYANKNLQIEASGACSVTHWGDAEAATSGVSGIGKIKRGN